MGKNVIIIGAGSAGLQAARRLCQAGYMVTVLEAASQPGGRILTLSAGGSHGFSVVAEGGAEFVHGELPLTQALAKEAGVTLQDTDAAMERLHDGKQDHWHMDWPLLLQRMKMLPEDKPLAEFLDDYFSGPEYRGLRDSVKGMAEGYDLADLHTVSVRSLYEEWSAEGEESEFRPVGGYRQLIDWLAADCLVHGCELHYGAVVTSVDWSPGKVAVTTAMGAIFYGDLLVITVSLGVLKAGAIGFHPDISEQHQAIGRLGYGSVIKVLLAFAQPFWQTQKKKGKTLFVLSDEAVPTWWTQVQDECPLLTGWVSGERMRVFRGLDDGQRIESCLGSLAAIFGIDLAMLRRELTVSRIMDWETAPFVLGGYSFETVGSAAARKVLLEPVADTLYFAGEGLYDGDVPGTVEAAFCSGVQVAEKILGFTIPNSPMG